MKTLTIEQVPLSTIDFPSQVRATCDPAALAGLTQSIQETGVQQPVQLRPLGGGRYVPLDGERRCRAATAAGLSAVPALIIEDKLEAAEIATRQLTLNLQREGLTPLETARAIERVIADTRLTSNAIAKRLGLSDATVSRLLAMLTLPPEILASVEKGEIGPSAAAELARVDDPDQRKALAAEVASGRLTRDGLSGARKRSKSPSPAGNESAASRVTAMLGGGRSISVAGPGLDLERCIAWLEELLAKVRRVRSQNLELGTFVKMLRDQARADEKAVDPC